EPHRSKERAASAEPQAGLGVEGPGVLAALTVAAASRADGQLCVPVKEGNGLAERGQEDVDSFRRRSAGHDAYYVSCRTRGSIIHTSASPGTSSRAESAHSPASQRRRKSPPLIPISRRAARSKASAASSSARDTTLMSE